MDEIIEEPAYAKPADSKPRLLIFEIGSREASKREFARYGLQVVTAWTDDKAGTVKVVQGDLVFRVRPGARVFAEIKSA